MCCVGLEKEGECFCHPWDRCNLLQSRLFSMSFVIGDGGGGGNFGFLPLGFN